MGTEPGAIPTKVGPQRRGPDFPMPEPFLAPDFLVSVTGEPLLHLLDNIKEPEMREQPRGGLQFCRFCQKQPREEAGITRTVLFPHRSARF